MKTPTPYSSSPPSRAARLEQAARALLLTWDRCEEPGCRRIFTRVDRRLGVYVRCDEHGADDGWEDAPAAEELRALVELLEES